MSNIASVTSSISKSTSWKPWIVASKSGYNKPFSSPLPEGYFPAKSVWFAADFSNNFICISGVELLGWAAMAMAGGVGLSMASTVGIPSTLSIAHRRNGGYGSIGMSQRYITLAPSPRIGYSIGNLFKHQAYFAMDIVGMGWAVGLNPIVWLTTPGVMYIDSCSNCRIRRVYLKQGKVLGVRFIKEDGSQNQKMYVKISDKDLPPPSGVSASATVHVMKGSEYGGTETVSGTLTSGWEIECTGSGTYIAVGNFFELGTTLTIEDPATMHEYGLKEQSTYGGMTRTSQQALEVPCKFIGCWAPFEDPDPEIGTVWKATGVAGTTTLPLTKAESIRNKESMEFGGDGFDGIKEGDTARLIMDIWGGPGLQNFCAGNLVGEFVEIGGLHYEIVAHPRGDTIAISLYAAETKEKLDSMPSDGVITQQKFWMTSEQFVGIGPGSGGANRVYTSKNPVKAHGTSVSWDCYPITATIDNSTFALTQDEFGCKTLVERHAEDVGNGGGTKAYEKFERWKALIGDKSYKLKKLTVTNTNVTAEFFSPIEAEGMASIAYDEPYGSTSPFSQYYGYATFRPAVDQMGTWTVFMDGYYDGGIFSFKQSLPDDAQFSIVSNAFTVANATPKPPSYGLGNPFVYLTTQKGAINGVAATDSPLSGKPYVFFSDQDYGYLAYRTSLDPEWTEKMEQGLVRVGYYKDDGKNGDFITGMKFASSNDDASWIATPKSKYASESGIFGPKITGAGGVSSKFYRDNNLLSLPVATGVRFPIEVYGGYSPAYIPYEDSDGVGKVTADADTAKNILSGEGSGALSGSGATFEITPTTKLLRADGVKDAFSFLDGILGVVCSLTLSNWNGVGPEPTKTKDTTYALCVLTSTNDGFEWGSPKKTKSGNGAVEEWTAPLILQLDFEHAGTIFRKNTYELLMFGWVYEGGEDNYNKDEFLSLAMYRIAIPDFEKEDVSTIEIKDDKTGDIIGRYLENPYTSEFGRFGSMTTNAPGKFVKIIGNENAEASIGSEIIKDFPIEKGCVAPMWMGSSIRMFMHSEHHKGIISLISSNLGDTWEIETENDEPIIFARGEGGFPSIARQGIFGQIDSDNWLFYIANNALLCKKMDFTGIGSTTQEKLDKAVPVTVATDIQEHKSVSTTDRHGRMLVFYITSQGILSGSVSTDSGDHWETLKNF